ncbi:HpaII family restriction endonuclease, partial [Streptococcus pneumoniae]
DTQAYKQFGNSVAVPAIQATGKGVIQRLIENGALEGIEHENMGNTEQQTSSDNSGEIGLVTLNKGEWSEVYTVLKLLADGKLYAADSDLNKMESIYYPLIKILRSELLNKKLTNYEYLYEETIDCPEDVKIRVVHGDTSDTLLELSVEEFKNKSLQLLKD